VLVWIEDKEICVLSLDELNRLSQFSSAYRANLRNSIGCSSPPLLTNNFASV
jgi:hypothetical protein